MWIKSPKPTRGSQEARHLYNPKYLSWRKGALQEVSFFSCALDNVCNMYCSSKSCTYPVRRKSWGFISALDTVCCMWWGFVYLCLPSLGKRSPTQSMYTAAAQTQVETKNPRVNLLVSKWQQVWLLALDRRRKLNDALDRLEEVS